MRKCKPWNSTPVSLVSFLSSKTMLKSDLKDCPARVFIMPLRVGCSKSALYKCFTVFRTCCKSAVQKSSTWVLLQHVTTSCENVRSLGMMHYDACCMFLCLLSIGGRAREGIFMKISWLRAQPTRRIWHRQTFSSKQPCSSFCPSRPEDLGRGWNMVGMIQKSNNY